jgi:hypothetical protein
LEGGVRRRLLENRRRDDASPQELKELISGCDHMKPRIEAQEESSRKVCLRRLEMCREFYKYVIENKK